MLDRENLGDHASQGRAEQVHAVEPQRLERMGDILSYGAHRVRVGRVGAVVEQVHGEAPGERGVVPRDGVGRPHHARHAHPREDDQGLVPAPELEAVQRKRPRLHRGDFSVHATDLTTPPLTAFCSSVRSLNSMSAPFHQAPHHVATSYTKPRGLLSEGTEG